jgi:hypothetical protein
MPETSGPSLFNALLQVPNDDSNPITRTVDDSAASAANASGFLLVSLSKMSRRAAFQLRLSTSAPRHFRSRLATIGR